MYVREFFVTATSAYFFSPPSVSLLWWCRAHLFKQVFFPFKFENSCQMNNEIVLRRRMKTAVASKKHGMEWNGMSSFPFLFNDPPSIHFRCFCFESNRIIIAIFVLFVLLLLFLCVIQRFHAPLQCIPNFFSSTTSTIKVLSNLFSCACMHSIIYTIPCHTRYSTQR